MSIKCSSFKLWKHLWFDLLKMMIKFKRLLLQITTTTTNESSTKNKCQRKKTVMSNRSKCFRRKGSCSKELRGVTAAERIRINKVFLPNLAGITPQH